MQNSVMAQTVVMVGCGNIGSHIAPLLARFANIRRLIVVDPDSYDESNVLSQNIRPGDVGRGKAEVTAARIRAIAPQMQVHWHALPVEQVPLGKLRADLILAAPDNRRARQSVNQAAWRLHTPWLDVAVDGDGQLARIGLFVPGEGAPCHECAYTEEDYAQLETRFSCAGDEQWQTAETAAPTGASAEIGALAASLACIETRKVLAGDMSLAGRQLLFDARFHRQFVAVLPYNAACLFDHSPWRIENVGHSPDELSLADAFGLAGKKNAAAAIRYEGQTFVTRTHCRSCGQPSRRLLRLSDRLRPAQRRCHGCGGRREAAGFDREPQIDAASVSPRWLAKPLSELGYVRGDVLSLVVGSRERHYQLGGSAYE